MVCTQEASAVVKILVMNIFSKAPPEKPIGTLLGACQTDFSVLYNCLLFRQTAHVHVCV